MEKEGLEKETEASVEVGTEFRSECTDGVIAAMREDFQEFKAEVVDLGDDRSGNAVKYTVASILNIARLAALRGSFTVKDIARYAEEKFDFLKQFFDLPDRPPSHWTFNRVLGKLDAEKFIKYLFKDVAEPFAFILGKLACDGKLLNGSSKKSRNPAVTGVVTAVGQESGLIVNIAPYGQGIGEIPGMKDLFHGINITSAWISADALHLQTETAEIIIGNGGNYCLAVRGNQPTIKETVHEFVRKRGERYDGQFFVAEKCHGREVVKQYRIWYLSKKDQARLGFPGIKMIETCFATYGCKGLKPRNCPFSEKVSPETAGDLIGNPWSTEMVNWEADTTHDEDHHQVLNPNLAVVLAVIRRWSLNVNKLSGIKDSRRGIYKRASMSDKTLCGLIINHKVNVQRYFSNQIVNKLLTI